MTAMKRDKTHNTDASTPTFPVSKKFFSYIRERIGDACKVYAGGLTGDDNTHGSEDIFAASMAAVEAYISEGRTPEEGAPAPVRMILALLRPEIDRAAKRSASARLRAARRKAEREAAAEEAATDRPVTERLADDENIADEEAIEEALVDEAAKQLVSSLMTRSVRRRMLREEKRRQKKGSHNKKGHPSARR